MELTRTPFQGVLNIVRFNWHFYVITFALVSLLVIMASYFDKSLQPLIYFVSILALISGITSLLVSLYIYDLSGLYNLKWIDNTASESLIVNISAGFDETSTLLKDKFKTAELIALDFFDPVKHTEISIKRARKAYPVFPKTKQVETSALPLADNSADIIFVIFSAHEIRNEIERAAFFKELTRVIKPTGKIYIAEHLRDLSNFLAYNIGFFHFYSRVSWLNMFKSANLEISREFKLTPFISSFILVKNGNTI
jgi:SAM-dependent methyltransferase